MKKALFISMISLTWLLAMDVNEIIKKMEDNLRGTNSYQEIVMTIQNSRTTRTMKMESWAMGDDKSFIRINYPRKDKGITFLKLDNQMWQYIPKIEKTIKIPASMMMQSWMGSDFTNDDMVKESSMVDDYEKVLLQEQANTYILRLTPKPNAAVVWGKIEVAVDKKTFAPVYQNFYDEAGNKERTMQFEQIKRVDGRYVPHKMIIEPQSEDKKENITTVTLKTVSYSPKLDEHMFTKRGLKRYSK